VIDPLDGENQALRINGGEQNVSKPLPFEISNGASGTLFLRMMRDGIVDGFAGLSDEAAPTKWSGTKWSGFETQFGVQNSAPDSFRVRDGDNFASLDRQIEDSQIEVDVWYCVWVDVNNVADQYQVFVQGGAYTERTQLSATGQMLFDFRNGGANALTAFQTRLGVQTAGVLFIDDILIDPDDVNAEVPNDILCGEPLPEPTATMEPTAEPEPTVTAEPEPTATMELEPTAITEPEPTVTAEPEPTASVIPEPTVTASATTEPVAVLQAVTPNSTTVTRPTASIPTIPEATTTPTPKGIPIPEGKPAATPTTMPTSAPIATVEDPVGAQEQQQIYMPIIATNP